MNKKTISAIVVAVIAVAGFFYYKNHNQETGSQQAYAGGKPVLKVSTAVMRTEPIMLTMALPGRTSAFKQSQVRPQVTGIIKERLFKEGAYVEKGQQLYQLDDARYTANLKSAEANLLSAEANFKATRSRYNRIKSLVVKNAVSQQDLDDVIAELDQAKRLFQ